MIENQNSISIGHSSGKQKLDHGRCEIDLHITYSACLPANPTFIAMKLLLPSLLKQHCIASNTEKFNTIKTSRRLNMQITVIFMRSCE